MGRFLFGSEDAGVQTLIVFAGHLLFILVAALGLALLAARLRAAAPIHTMTSAAEGVWSPVLSGLATFLLSFVVLQVMVETHLPAWLPALFALRCCVGGGLLLARRTSLVRTAVVRFLLGCGIGQTVVVVIGFTGILGGDTMTLVVGLIALTAYVLALAALRRRYPPIPAIP